MSIENGSRNFKWFIDSRIFQRIVAYYAAVARKEKTILKNNKKNKITLIVL